MDTRSSRSGDYALLLAAGAGSRFGGRKMLAQAGDLPLVAASAQIALSAPVEKVFVVLGADAQHVTLCLEHFGSRLHFVSNPEWQSGLASSLKVGLRALPSDARAAVVFLGDMPRVPVDLAGRLLQAIHGGAPAAVAEFEGRAAHPAAFSSAMFEAIGSLAGDRGARQVLESHPDLVRICTDDPGACFDIDEAVDLTEWRAGRVRQPR